MKAKVIILMAVGLNLMQSNTMINEKPTGGADFED